MTKVLALLKRSNFFVRHWPLWGIWLLLLLYVAPLFLGNNLIGLPGDPYAYLWQVDWQCQAFSHYNFISRDFFAFTGINLASGYVMPLPILLACPFQFLGDRILLNLIASTQLFVVAGVYYVFLRRFVARSQLLQMGFLLLYVFCGFFFNRIQGHIDIVSLMWTFPLMCLVWDAYRPQNLKKNLILGLSYAVAFTVSWQNIPLLFPLTVFLGLYTFYKHRRIWLQQPLPTVLNLGLAATAFLLLFVPLGWPMIHENLSRAESIMIDLDNSRSAFSADSFSYLIPAQQTLVRQALAPLEARLLPMGIILFEGHAPLDPLVLLSLVLGIPGLIMLAPSQWRKQGIWLVLAAMYFLLSFWQYVKILGIPILYIRPISLLYDFPPFSFLRTPGRMAFGAYFFLTYFAFLTIGFFWKTLQRSSPSKANALAFVVVIFAVTWSIILPRNFRIPAHNYLSTLPLQGLTQIQQDTTNALVMNIPINPSIDPFTTLLQYYHQHDQLSGYVSSWSITPTLLAPLENDPYFSRFGCSNFPLSFAETATGLTPFANNDFLRDWPGLAHHLLSKNVSYIVVNKQLLQNNLCGPLSVYIQELMREEQYFTHIDETNTHLVLKVQPASPEVSTIPYRLENVSASWSKNDVSSIWIGTPSGVLKLYPQTNTTITVEANIFSYLPESPLPLAGITHHFAQTTATVPYRLQPNGQLQFEVELQPGVNEIIFTGSSCHQPLVTHHFTDSTCYSFGLNSISITPKK